MLEAFLSNFPILPVMHLAQSVAIATPVVAVRFPVHFCSLASYIKSKEEILLDGKMKSQN